MKERPIIFSAPMVRVILDGTKTQTRRVMRPQPSVVDESCPYGEIGDHLWVRETWCQQYEDGRAVEGKAWYKADGVHVVKDDGDGCTEFNKDGTEASPWKPSIHMPRWASRILLEITDVRVQRLQDITPDDCIAEGAWPVEKRELGRSQEAVDAFRSLWNDINLKRGHGWGTNPWVWAITFKRVER